MKVTNAQRLLRWLELVLGANVVAMILNVFTGVLSARILGPSGKGIYNAASVWAGVLASLVGMGLAPALISAYGSEANRALRARILGTTTLLAFFWGSAGAALGYFLIPVMIGHLGAPVVFWARLSVLMLPLGAVGQVGMSLLTVEHAFGRFSLFRVGQVLMIAVPLTLLAVWGFLTPYAYIAIVVGANLLAFAITAVLVWRLLRERQIEVKLGPGRLFRSLSALGFSFYAISLATLFNAQLDQMLASAWLDARDIGLYAVAISSLTVVGTIVGSFRAVFFPAVVGDDRDAIIRRTCRAVRSGWWLLGSLALILIVGSRPVLFGLYGHRYLAAWPAVVALAPAAVCAGILTILYQGCYALRLLRVPLIGEVVGAGSGALLLALLIPRWGIVGAGIAGSASYICDVAVVAYLWKRQHGVAGTLGPSIESAMMLVRLGREEVRAALGFVVRTLRAGRTAAGSVVDR